MEDTSANANVNNVAVADQQQQQQPPQESGGGNNNGGGQFGKLFIGQVPAVCTEEMLHPLFAPYGTIVEIKVMRDTSQRSKGCAWVRYENQAQAQSAIDNLHEKHTIPPQVNTLQVRYAHTSNTSGGGGGGARGAGGGNRGAQQQQSRGPQQGGGGQHRGGHQQQEQQQGNVPPSYAVVQNNPYAALWPGGGSFASSGNGSFGGHMNGYTQMQWGQYGNQQGQMSQQPKMQASPPGTSVFVGNLPPSVTSEELRTLICDHVPAETVSNVSIHRDRRFGFVTFETADAANVASQRLNGLEIFDRKIRVEVTQNEAKRTQAGPGGLPGGGYQHQGGYGGYQQGY